MIQIRKYKKFLVTLFVVSLVIRLGALLFYFQYNPCMTMYDSGHYHQLAQSLVQGLGYVGADGAPYFYRLPGYPFFLAICYFFAGIKPVAALAMQCVLASIIPVLIFISTSVMFPASLLTAQVTALVSCFHVGYIIYANLLMAETLFLIFFLLFLICFFNGIFIFETGILRSNLLCFNKVCHPREPKGRVGDPVHIKILKWIPAFARMTDLKKSRVYLQGQALLPQDYFVRNSEFTERSGKNLCYAGLFLGIVSLIRPVGHFVMPVALLLLLCNLEQALLKRIKNGITLVLSWLLVVAPWLIRNYLLTGMFFFHTLSGPHFINHSAIRLAQADNNLSYEQAKKQVYHDVDQALARQEKKICHRLNQAEASSVMEQVARSYITKNIWQTIKHCAINIFKTAFSLYSSELLVIEQEGALPEYDESRSFVSMIKRFLFPQVKHKAIWLVIYFELIMWLIILIGCGGFCVRSFFNRSWLVSLAQSIPFIFLFLILSCACGFARLRLPVEHFVMMMGVAFWIKKATPIQRSFNTKNG